MVETFSNPCERSAGSIKSTPALHTLFAFSNTGVASDNRPNEAATRSSVRVVPIPKGVCASAILRSVLLLPREDWSCEVFF